MGISVKIGNTGFSDGFSLGFHYTIEPLSYRYSLPTKYYRELDYYLDAVLTPEIFIEDIQHLQNSVYMNVQPTNINMKVNGSTIKVLKDITVTQPDGETTVVKRPTFIARTAIRPEEVNDEQSLFKTGIG